MAPISPISRKRSTPSENDDVDDHIGKKRRLYPTTHYTPPSKDVRPQPHCAEGPFFDTAVQELLLRSVSLALEYVGFQGADPEALNALCNEADTYATHFLSRVTLSMLNARRSQPTPLDFDYALSEFNLPLSFLEPHLRPPIPQSKLKVQLESETSEQGFNSQLFLLAPDLSGEPDKKAKVFVPDRFPSFPSKHTYKYTDKESARETDPRKIREEAAKAARQGEDALRRLNRVSKAGKEKDIKKAAQQDPGSKERHKLFEETMASLVNGDQQTTIGRSDEDHTLVVNAQSIYFRKKAVPKKKQVDIPADTIRVEI